MGFFIFSGDVVDVVLGECQYLFDLAVVVSMILQRSAAAVNGDMVTIDLRLVFH